LSVLGGAIGVVIGTLASEAIATRLQWPARISVRAIWVAFGVSASIGVGFGYYPAFRAARLEPIDALRIE
jgi:ABC-type antimicrobial peptide transport system permease subunit